MTALVEPVTPVDVGAIQLELDRLARQVKGDALTLTLIRWVLEYRTEQPS